MQIQQKKLVHAFDSASDKYEPPSKRSEKQSCQSLYDSLEEVDIGLTQPLVVQSEVRSSIKKTAVPMYAAIASWTSKDDASPRRTRFDGDAVCCHWFVSAFAWNATTKIVMLHRECCSNGSP